MIFNILSIFILIHIILTIFLIINRFICYYIKPRKLYGMDKKHHQWSKKNNMNVYTCCELYFEKSKSKEILERLKKKIINEHNNDTSMLHTVIDDKKEEFISYKQPIEKILLEKSNLLDEEILNSKKNTFPNCVFNLKKEKNSMSICVDHSIADGVSAYRTVGKFFNINNIDWVSKEVYFPIISETLQIYTLIKLLYMKYNITDRLELNIDGGNEINYNHILNIEKIKYYKKKFNSKFTAALIGIYCLNIFKNLKSKKKKLHVGIISAFENNRFKNNYSLVIISIINPFFIDTLETFESKLKYLIENIQNQFIQKKKIECNSLYQLSTTATFLEGQGQGTASIVDILFSPFIAENKGDLKYLTAFTLKMFYISTAVYVFALSIGESVHVNTILRTRDILGTFDKSSYFE